MLRLSFLRLFQGVVRLPLTFALTAIALVVVSLASSQWGSAYWTYETAATGRVGHDLASVAWAFVSSASRWLVLTPLSIAMYRFVLRDEASAWRASNIVTFLAWLVLLDSPTTIADAVRVTWSVRSAVALSSTGLVAASLTLVMGIRLWLIFPAVALGEPAPFFERVSVSWRQTQGHFWYLFWLDIVVTFALALPFSLASYAMVGLTVANAAAQPRSGMRLTYLVVATLIASVGAALRVAGKAAMGGSFYRATIDGGMSGAEQTAAHFT